MSKQLPQFLYLAPSPSNSNRGSINADGQLIHRIADMVKFYEAMGYTSEMQKRGVLAEEYLWEEYVKDSSPFLSDCFQKHLVEYLMKNSPQFVEKYDQVSKQWIAEHANIRSVSRSFCNNCRMKQFCEPNYK